MKFEFFATTAKGMEELLAQELAEIGSACGIEVAKPVKAGVPFRGPIEAAYRACLYSRIANRILLPLKTFPSPSPEKLYGAVKSVRWSDHLTSDQTIAVDFTASHSQITHSHYGALKTKDAICDQMTSIHGSRPSVDTQQPDLRINVYLNNDQATVSLDLSGNSLHQRGYRSEQREAPLKETLAAAILKLSGFEEILKNGGGLVDPMCGSGTIVLEAAQIAARIAPGLGREYFGFMGWKKHEPELWAQLRAEAESLRITDPKKLPQLTGYDSDFRAIQVALSNLEAAGLRGFAHFEKRELSGALPPPHHSTGLFIVNPPYGERLGEEEELKPLYRSIGDAMKQRFKGWKGAVLTGSAVLAKEVGLKARRRHVLFNGAIECRLLTYDLYPGSPKG
jgi:23S rRNA (guanine2445-N2)-methyltransferase / 23S rRNA (guanine2069-N7)-methyltransferase